MCALLARYELPIESATTPPARPSRCTGAVQALSRRAPTAIICAAERGVTRVGMGRIGGIPSQEPGHRHRGGDGDGDYLTSMRAGFDISPVPMPWRTISSRVTWFMLSDSELIDEGRVLSLGQNTYRLEEQHAFDTKFFLPLESECAAERFGSLKSVRAEEPTILLVLQVHYPAAAKCRAPPVGLRQRGRVLALASYELQASGIPPTHGERPDSNPTRQDRGAARGVSATPSRARTAHYPGLNPLDQLSGCGCAVVIRRTRAYQEEEQDGCLAGATVVSITYVVAFIPSFFPLPTHGADNTNPPEVPRRVTIREGVMDILAYNGNHRRTLGRVQLGQRNLSDHDATF
ncbi:hypothetical protein DFH08DRAFT_997294 [Mycena albidolilacea]|uniref:Uncharacterized protein n=1 Tax=Mycena albidolilacea TaxID=1033008 RepID=A0AAD7ESP9_9AGAR|nr:hypothetical protein DFH08DRAFT_997294 [Mycena albidolilacea]